MKIKEMFQAVFKWIAKLYNLLPQKVQIAMYVATSTIIASLITLVIRDLTNLHIDNEYLEVLVTGIIPVLTIIVNIIQKVIVEYGTKLLAISGDANTLDMLHMKLEKNTTLIESVDPKAE